MRTRYWPILLETRHWPISVTSFARQQTRSFVVIWLDTPDIRRLFRHQNFHQLCQGILELSGRLQHNNHPRIISVFKYSEFRWHCMLCRINSTFPTYLWLYEWRVLLLTMKFTYMIVITVDLVSPHKTQRAKNSLFRRLQQRHLGVSIICHADNGSELSQDLVSHNGNSTVS